MLRAAALFTSLCLAAAPVAAEPAAEKAEKAAEPAAKQPAAKQPAAKQPAAAKPAARPRPAPDLSRAASTAARRAGVAAPAPRPVTLDLTPSRVIEDVARKSRLGSERSPGLSLGDDGDWKVHAAQVGVMAAGFAALTALCSGGSCLLPDAATDWIPGMDRDVAAPPVELRDVKPLRSAR